jgi:hypothetical protein
MHEQVEHLWTVVCQSIHQGAGGLLSLDGLIDMVSIPSLPHEPALVRFECFVASQWRRNDDPGVELSQRLMFQRERDTTSRVQLAGPDPVRVVDRHLFSVINKITALPLRGYGQYFFVVEWQTERGWEAVAPTAGLWVPSQEMLGASGQG